MRQYLIFLNLEKENRKNDSAAKTSFCFSTFLADVCELFFKE